MCSFENLEELINLYDNGILTRKMVEQDCFALSSACNYGNLEVCKWLYKTFQITKKEALLYNSYVFQQTCGKGHLEVCQWLCETFQITKKEATLNNNRAFWWACYNDHYHIISFLCNTFGITDVTEEDVKNIIEEYPEEKQEKILDCLTPFGSFTKPVKK
jgi:hypothetical protein